jgi:tetratricopeptide (TPR) repeat protein
MKRIVLLLAAAAMLAAAALEDEARAHFSRGDYPASARAYQVLAGESAEDAVLRYNLGTALLHAGDFERARAELGRAARANDPEIARDALYNLGNADLFPAIANDPSPERREMLLRAVAAYRAGLLLDPADQDARWNLELAQRLLNQESPPPPSPDAPSGGGGAGEGAAPGAEGDPTPRPADGPGPAPTLTPEEAEELVASAEAREVGTQQERLRRPQPPVQTH